MIELSNVKNDNLSSLSAISQQKSNLDEHIDIGNHINKKKIDKQRLYLDVELHLRAEDENSFDEAHFNLEKNTQNYLRNAFESDEIKLKHWEDKFIQMMKDENIINDEINLDEFLIQNKLKNKVENQTYFTNVKYSFNQINEDIEEKFSDEGSSYFTKFIIFVNLIFRVSYIYKYSYDLGYKKTLNTIYNILILEFFNFDKNETLFSLDNMSNQYAFLSLILLWLISFTSLFYMVSQSSVIMRTSLENFSINYEFKVKSSFYKCIFNLNLIMFIYLYIPVVRDSIRTIFFTAEKANSTDSVFKIFFNSAEPVETIVWVRFILCLIVVISFFIVPFFFYRLLNNNHPLLNPFDHKNDTVYHSTDCPLTCSGSLLDIDKRMCWDFVKNKSFKVDLNRPIFRLNLKQKRENVLNRYIKDCQTINSPIMIFFKGFSYENKNKIFRFLIQHYIFIFISQLPYSTVFPDFIENNMQRRGLIKYSLCTLACGYLLYYSIKHFKTKFVYLHDSVLSLIVDIFVFLIASLGLSKVAVLGDYLYLGQETQNNQENNKLLIYFEAFTFSCFCFCVLILIIFMIYSIPQIRNKIIKKTLVFPMEWLEPNKTEIQLKEALIELLWKPFWDNLFKRDLIMNEDIPFTDKNFIETYTEGKEIDISIPLKDFAANPFKRLKMLKKRHLKSSEEANYEFNKNIHLTKNQSDFNNNSENFTQPDILFRKWLQFNLEGIDAFWDGDVIGIRSCHNFFGRLIINENPFKLIIIYDETNEKVEIPQTEWVNLARLNLQNKEIVRQVSIRDKLRCLDRKEVKYDEFFFDKGRKFRKQMEMEEEKEKLLSNKKIKNKKTPPKVISSKLDLNSEEILNGILHVESIIPEHTHTHGFKIYMEVTDIRNPSKTKEIINFDPNDICLNERNFRYSKLNILLSMNDDLIREEHLNDKQQKKENYRDQISFKRFIEEITLSAAFFNLVYNNQDVSLIEILKYFLKFEKRLQMRIFPIYHLEGLLRAINLWQLCLTNPIQTLWYVFFSQVWIKNKKILKEKKLSKYFNPDTSLGICYYVFDRDKLNSFINKLDLQSLFPKEVIDKLEAKMNELKEMEKDKMEDKLKEGKLNGVVDVIIKDKESSKNSKKKKKSWGKKTNEVLVEDSSRVNLNINDKSADETKSENQQRQEINIDEEKLEYFLSNYQPVRDKLTEVILEYSPCMTSIPTWIYLSYHDGFKLEKLHQDITQDYREIINSYFSSSLKNPNKLFEELMEHSLLTNLYTNSEIFELFQTKNFQVEDPLLAKFTLDRNSEEVFRTINLKTKNKPQWLTPLDWSSKELELSLPPVLKFADEKFSKPLESGIIQKIDNKGRIFYVNKKTKKTSFMHPQLKKRIKTKLENEVEMLYGKLPEGWEVLNYKLSSGDIRLLFIDHNTKKTSWIDPRRNKLINE